MTWRDWLAFGLIMTAVSTCSIFLGAIMNLRVMRAVRADDRAAQTGLESGFGVLLPTDVVIPCRSEKHAQDVVGEMLGSRVITFWVR